MPRILAYPPSFQRRLESRNSLIKDGRLKPPIWILAFARMTRGVGAGFQPALPVVYRVCIRQMLCGTTCRPLVSTTAVAKLKGRSETRPAGRIPGLYPLDAVWYDMPTLGFYHRRGEEKGQVRDLPLREYDTWCRGGFPTRPAGRIPGLFPPDAVWYDMPTLGFYHRRGEVKGQVRDLPLRAKWLDSVGCYRVAENPAASMPARAQSSSSWAVPPLPPTAPIISPPRKTGNAPCPGMKWPPSMAMNARKIGA